MDSAEHFCQCADHALGECFHHAELAVFSDDGGVCLCSCVSIHDSLDDAPRRARETAFPLAVLASGAGAVGDSFDALFDVMNASLINLMLLV